MKNNYLFVIFLTLYVNFSYAQITPEPISMDSTGNFTAVDTTTIFNLVERMPSWSGCEKEIESSNQECTISKIQEFLGKNIRYPKKSRKKRIGGTVYIKFVIGIDGKVIESEVLRGVNEELDMEALRVVNLMPAWNPAIQRGKPVKVQYTLPIRFSPM